MRAATMSLGPLVGRALRAAPLLLLLGGAGCPSGIDPADGREPSAFSGQTLSLTGGLDRPAAQQADINIKLRGMQEVNEARELIAIGGPTDDKAPRLNSMFDGGRVPGMLRVYRVGVFAGIASGLEGGEAVHVAEFRTNGGEAIRTPRSGYDIGGGMAALVLYADEDSVLLKYTRDDGITIGYGIHLLGLAVDSALLASYRSCNAAGRHEMPALAAGDAVGRASGSVKVVVRDSGSFMDPRSRKDWYDGGAPVEPAPQPDPTPPNPAPAPNPTPPNPAPPPNPTPPPNPPPAPAPAPAPAQGQSCTANGITLEVNRPLQAGGTVDLTVRGGAELTWVMGGVGSASGINWRGGAINVGCDGGCHWTFPGIPVTGAAPFTLHFRRDAVNDSPGAGVEVASCRP